MPTNKKNDFLALQKCIKQCAKAVHSALQSENSQNMGYLDSTNSSGDTQLAVDVACDLLIEKNLLALQCVGAVCSEEKQEAVYAKDFAPNANDSSKNDSSKNDSKKLDSSSAKSSPIDSNSALLVAYDPLDGSSLFDSNLSVGSIFGIYEGRFESSHIVAACYVVYGPRLELVWADSIEKKVEHFLYDFASDSWLQKPALKLQKKGKLNAPGGTQKHWSAKHKNLIDSIFAQGYRLRYSGGMVPDLHQILVKGGGLFSYPATKDAPKGKLRKLFEVFPFAFIYEIAGGSGIDGKSRLLTLGCEGLHDTTQCFLGSDTEISLVKEAYK